MAGCDYIDNFKGIGFMTLLNHYYEKNSKEELKVLMDKKSNDPNESKNYLNKVENIINAFRHQIIYDPTSETLKDLREPKSNSKLSKAGTNSKSRKIISSNKKYTGNKFYNFERFVRGELDFKTMKPRPASNVDFDKMIKFFSYIPQPRLGALNNLCERTVNYENFEKCSKITDKCMGKVKPPYRREDHMSKRKDPRKPYVTKNLSEAQESNSSNSTDLLSGNSSVRSKNSRHSKKISKNKKKV